MRIVAISDVHGNIDAFEAVLASIGAYDHLLLLGDLVGFGPAPELVMQRVDEIRPVMVLGNWDDYVANPSAFARFEALAGAAPVGGKPFRPPVPLPALRENRKWTEERLGPAALRKLRSLPFRLSMRFGPDFTLELFHASPESLEAGLPGVLSDDELVARTRSTAGVTLYGHTHAPYHRAIEGRHFVNVSSVGLPLDGIPEAAYTVIEREEGSVTIRQHRVAYDVDAAVRRLRESRTPGAEWIEQILRTGRPAEY